MKNLNVNVEVSDYSINGVHVRFLPTDAVWLETFVALPQEIEKLLPITPDEEASISADPYVFFSAERTRDKKIREKLDSVFGEGVSDAVYSGSMTALTDGVPVWAAFIMAVAEDIFSEIDRQQALSESAIKKYQSRIDKYRRKKRK